MEELSGIQAGQVTKSDRKDGYDRYQFFMGTVFGKYTEGKQSQQGTVSIARRS